MQLLIRRLCAIGSAGALVLAAGTSLAQQPPPQGQQSQGIDLHSALHIRPDQEAAWHAYEAASQPPPAMISFMRANAPRMATMTTPGRLDVMDQFTRMQADFALHRSAAIRRLYAALSPSQQHMFDQITAPRQGAQER